MSVQRRLETFSYAATASHATWTPRGPSHMHGVAPASLDEFTYQLSRIVGIAAMGAGILGTAALLFSI